MRLMSHIKKSSKYERYPEIFKEISPEPHRPDKRFKVKVESREEAKEALSSDIPILWIDSSHTMMLRYPMTIPDTIIVPREYEDVVKTGLDIRTFESMAPFRDTIEPRFEDVVIFMLTLDPLAARGMIERSDLDKEYLKKRIYQEELEEEASMVHLHDHIDMQVKEEPLDKDRILKIIDRNKVKEVVP